MPDVTVTPTLYISTIEPPAPLAGDLWWNSAIGVFFVYYDDGTSAQWVTTQPVKYINLAEIKAPAGGDLTGYYPNPTIIDNVVLEYPELRNPLTLPDYSERLASTKWVSDKFASQGILGQITEGPGILLTPNPLAGDSTIALKAISPPVAPGPYGALNRTAVFEVNIYGQITSISDVAIPPVNSPTFTGIPAGPTAVPGTNTTQFATTAFVTAGIGALASIYAPIASPTFTGTPTAPTPVSISDGTNIATTEWVRDRIDASVADTTLDTRAQLRALTVAYQSVFVKGLTNENDGWGGMFVRDGSDTTSPDDGSLVIVSAISVRYKRVFNGVAYLRWFAALGNGGDDNVALQAAFDAQAIYGFVLDGEDLTYGTSVVLQLTATDAWLQNLELIALDPAATQTEMLSHQGPANSMTLWNVRFNRNGDGTEGILTAKTLEIEHCDNVLLVDVEMYGDGAGGGICVQDATCLRIVRPHVHDMTWVRVTNPLQELIVGIRLVLCTNVVIDGHTIKNLLGTVGGVDQFGPVGSYRNTDGISLTGCNDVLIVNGNTYAVGEGVDVTGSLLNTEIRLRNNNYYDCAGYAEKYVHGAHNCSTYGARSYRAGLGSFAMTRGAAGETASAKNFVAFDFIAYDTAIDGSWAASNTAGFRIDDPGGIPPAPPLENLWFVDCKSYSTAAKYGFLNTGVAADQLHLIGFDATGATIANVSGVTQAYSEITSTGRFHYVGGLDSRIDSAALPTQLLLQNHDVGVNAGIWQRFTFATGGVDTGDTAGLIELRAIEDWTVTANKTSRMTFSVMQDGTLVDAFFINGAGIQTGQGIRSTSASAGIGYSSGAGGTVAQGSGSGKATGVALNRVCGTITMDAASLAADTSVSFVLTNTSIAAGDMVLVQHKSGGTLGAYTVSANANAASTCTITVHNSTAGALAEAIVLQFICFRAVTA